MERERGGGQNGRKEGEEGKLWLEARHRIIIPVRLPVSPLFSLSHQQPGSPLFLGSGHHSFIQRGNHTTHDDGWWMVEEEDGEDAVNCAALPPLLSFVLSGLLLRAPSHLHVAILLSDPSRPICTMSALAAA